MCSHLMSETIRLRALCRGFSAISGYIPRTTPFFSATLLACVPKGMSTEGGLCAGLFSLVQSTRDASIDASTWSLVRPERRNGSF